jgi:membrane fusion protein (multidrug efflux system)
VLVTDNMAVAAGQLLVEIDSAEARTQLGQAEAQRAPAVAAHGQAEGQLVQARSQRRAAEAASAQAGSQAAGLAVEAANAQRDYARYRGLQADNPAAVAQQRLDQARTQAATSSAQARAAADQARAAAAQVGSVRGQILAAQAQIKAAEAQIGAADARIAQVRLGLSYARLTAPIAGHVTRLNIAPGSYVQPGQEVMAIVPTTLWVTANFKETQLARMRPGQPVDFSIAACAGETLSGHVDSIQRGAGQAFQLLPPENATGNFVKVVQRVPVKIVFDKLPRDCVLGPGMSVTPRVRVR